MKRRRGAWATVEAAEEAAAAAFGEEWPLDRLMAEVEAGDRLREVRDGHRLLTRSGSKVRRALALITEAQALAAEGAGAFDHLGDYLPPDGVDELPGLLAGATAQLQRAAKATAAPASVTTAANQLPWRRKRRLMRAALRVGIEARPSDWGYAFIALGIDKVCSSAAKWARRIIDLSSDLRAVRKSIG